MRRLLALTLLAVLLPAARAVAADYYVTQAGGGDCSQASPCTMQEALLGASTTDDLDRIHVVGMLTQTSPVDLSSPIELLGSGSTFGGTFINASGGGTAVTVGADSTVRDVRAKSSDSPAFEVAAGGTLAGVAAEADWASGARGAIETAAGSRTTRISDSKVTAGDAFGILSSSPLELTRSTVTAFIGVDVERSSTPSRVERSKVTARIGVQASGAHVTVASTVIRTDGASTRGINALGSSDTGPFTVVDVRGSTIRHTGATTNAEGVHSRGADTSINLARAEVSVRSSIVRGNDTDLMSATTFGPSGRLAVDHSDFHSSSGPAIENGGANVDLDPHWLDPAADNYGLAADSPLIDIGGSDPLDSTEAGTDFAGLARMLDGNGDGFPAREMGAFEYPAPLASFTATPDAVTVGEPVSFDASGSSYGRGELNRYEWDLDGNGTFEIDQGGRTVSHTYSEAGTLTVSLRVTGPDGGRGRTTRTVTVAPAA